MNARYPVLILALAAVVGVAIVTIGAQQSATNVQSDSTSWTQTKTPWGDPDLQGVWRYEAAIPLERPARFAGRSRSPTRKSKRANGSRTSRRRSVWPEPR